jgi:Domain of unknown function DUF29
MTEYETDVVSWSEHQSGLLRQHAAALRANDPAIDWPNIIEEIESVGRSERLALSSHTRIILEHLAKLEASPAVEPRNGWRQTVLRARAAADEVLEESPSLRPGLDAVIKREMRRVRPLVAEALGQYGEAPRVKLEQVEYSKEHVLGPWFPDDGN